MWQSVGGVVLGLCVGLLLGRSAGKGSESGARWPMMIAALLAGLGLGALLLWLAFPLILMGPLYAEHERADQAQAAAKHAQQAMEDSEKAEQAAQEQLRKCQERKGVKNDQGPP